MTLDRIKTALPKMQPTNHKIALYILEKGQTAGFSSTRALARQVGVSEASVVRFAQGLGFKGYNDFRHALQEDIRRKLDIVDKVALSDLDILPAGERLRKLAVNEMRNLKKTLDELDPIELQKMIDGVSRARRLYLGGFGVSTGLIRILEYSLLGILEKDVVAITGSVSDYSPRLHSFTPSDALILMTFPPYSREAIQVGRFAKREGGKLYLFTDSPRCPLYPEADAVARCENNSLLLTNSYVGLLAVVQIFVNMLLLSDKKGATARRRAVRTVESKGYDELADISTEE